MQKESVSTQTFIKGVAAAAVVAASLGALNYAEYSTADKGGDHTFVPGSYSASAKGMESDVKVKITVDEHSITDVSVDVSGETDGIGAAIGDEVSSQILAAQSSSIDGVAGASVSSQAVRDALDAAIAKAEKGEADEEAAAEPVEEENGTEPETAGEPEETGSSRIKGLFKKKKDKKDQQIEELTDRVRRQMAEFDNFRKRTEKEKAAMYEIGAKSVIEKILPVVDNFERGLAGQSEESDPFTEGMFKIYRQMISTLEAMDVKPIEAVGQPFDPELHNAVMHVDDESVGENVIVEELQKGYKYRDSVVRYSMVKVAN